MGRRPEQVLVAAGGLVTHPRPAPGGALHACCGLWVWVVLSGIGRSLRKSFVRRLVAAGQGRVPGCSNALCACMSPPRECLSCVRDRLRLRLGVGCLRRINTVTVTVIRSATRKYHRTRGRSIGAPADNELEMPEEPSTTTGVHICSVYNFLKAYGARDPALVVY